MTYDGPAVQTSSADLVAGTKDGPTVDIGFHVEAKMAVPPWVQGALQADADSQLRTSSVGAMMGGPRYEQLFTATGEFHAAGQRHEFTGSGLRIRRTGVRKLAGFWGHCWQSALFGSGRAFGYIAYSPRPDGQPTFNEGFVFTGDGGLIPARAVQAPWLTRLQPLGEDASLVLQTADGVIEIAGETVFSTHDIHHNDDMYSMQALKQEMASFPAVQQAGVLYSWDGEQAYGMLERSNPLDKITRGTRQAVPDATSVDWRPPLTPIPCQGYKSRIGCCIPPPGMLRGSAMTISEHRTARNRPDPGLRHRPAAGTISQVTASPAEMSSVKLEIAGMSCASCAMRIEEKLNQLDGVQRDGQLRDRNGHRHRAVGV